MKVAILQLKTCSNNSECITQANTHIRTCAHFPLQSNQFCKFNCTAPQKERTRARRWCMQFKLTAVKPCGHSPVHRCGAEWFSRVNTMPNRHAHSWRAGEAADQGADFALLPEMWSMGYSSQWSSGVVPADDPDALRHAYVTACLLSSCVFGRAQISHSSNPSCYASD